MKLRQKYLNIISGIAPVGAVGVSLLLGSTISSDAAERVMHPPPRRRTDRVRMVGRDS